MSKARYALGFLFVLIPFAMAVAAGPTLTIDSFPVITNANKTAVPLGGTCDDGLPVDVHVGSASASTVCAAGAWSATLDLSVFGEGTLTASASSTDANGDTIFVSTNSYKDTTGPVINAPPDIITEAPSAAGATANFSTTALDAHDGPAGVSCTPVSGSTFSLGSTTVTCSASDAVGNTSSTTFAVVVRDTTPPGIVPPADQTFESSGPLTPALTQATSTDAVDGNPAITYTPHTFSVGSTVVTWTATDFSGNSVSATSTVTVTLPPTPSGGGGGGGGPIWSNTIAPTPSILPTVPVVPAAGGEVLGAQTYRFTKYLVRGSKGDAVLNLQKLLVAKKLLAADSATGYFGLLTQAALKQYQKQNNITQTGTTGPLTRAALNKEAGTF